jgi:cell division protein FtsB
MSTARGPLGDNSGGLAELAQPSRPRRTFSRWALILIAGVLLLNALIGERGLLATLNAVQARSQLLSDIATIREENTLLRQYALQLRKDPETIEAVARRELGLIRPGERLFLFSSSQKFADSP